MLHNPSLSERSERRLGVVMGGGELTASLGEAECIYDAHQSGRRSALCYDTEPYCCALRALCLSEARHQVVQHGTYIPSLRELRSLRLGL